MANSKRKCSGCGEYEEVTKGLSTPSNLFFHDVDCMFLHIEKLRNRKAKKALAAIKKKTKEFKKETRERKESLKSRGDWIKEAQAQFNRYVRARDYELPCISCQRYHEGQYHAGHYRSVGGNPELRFEELNNNKQCAPCNNHLSGNLVDYRINLIKKIGLDKVEWLEGPHEPKKYTIEEIKDIKAKYRKLANELEKELS